MRARGARTHERGSVEHGLRLLVAGVVLVGAVAWLGPAPTGAALGDPPSSVALGVDDARAIAVEPETGRVFVVGDDGLAVHEADGTPVGVIPVAGSEVTAVEGDVVVLDPQAGTVTRVDAADLTVTTWDLAPRNRLSGLVASGDRAWTSARAVDGTTSLVEIELGDGTVTDVATGQGTRPWLFARGYSRVVAVEVVPVGSDDATVVRRITDLESERATVTMQGTIPQHGVEAVAVTHDGVRLSVVSADAPAEVRVYSERDLVPTDTLVAPGPGVRFGGSSWLLALAASDGPAEVTVMAPGAGHPALTFDLAATGADGPPTAMGFDELQTRLYVTFPSGAPSSRLAVIDLVPVVTRTSPLVIDRASEAVPVSIEGRGLTDASVRVDYTQAEVRGGDDRTLVVAVRGRSCCGSELSTVRVASPIGTADETTSIRFADLRPYRDSHHLADGLHAGLVGRRATDAERAAVGASVFAHGDVGRAVTEVAARPDLRGRRPSVLRLYRAVLGRGADVGGLAYWADQLERGRSLGWVGAFFAGSGEFRRTYGSLDDGRFIDLLYRHVLGRDADPAGRAYWLDRLQRGITRGRVAVLFSTSTENKTWTAPEVDLVFVFLATHGRMPTAVELGDLLPVVRQSGRLPDRAASLLRSATALIGPTA